MTFQVALIGNNGIVLVSDRLFVERGLRGFMDKRTPHQRQVSEKIMTSGDKNTVCAFAGGPHSETIARRIVTACNPHGLSDVEWRNSLEAATKLITKYSENLLDEIIVIRCDNVSVLKLIRQQNNDPSFMAVTSQVCSGIDSYARAIPQFFWHSDMDVEALTTLGIVTIDYARLEHPHLIGGGIDIVKIDSKGNFTKQSFEESETAEIRAAFVEQVRRSLNGKENQ